MEHIKTYAVTNSDVTFFWKFKTVHTYYHNKKVWKAETIHTASNLEYELPNFIDDTPALLLNAIERFCLLNDLSLDIVYVLEQNEKGYFLLNGESVFISYRWAISARYKYSKSKRIRIQNFEVLAENIESARSVCRTKFNGANLQEIISITPTDFGLCYWRDRPNCPPIDTAILSTIELPLK